MSGARLKSTALLNLIKTFEKAPNVKVTPDPFIMLADNIYSDTGTDSQYNHEVI